MLEASISRDTATPCNLVATVLSPSSVITATSSFAIFPHQSQQTLAVGYRRIGFGLCGII
ncbi:hypothetical protein DPV78_005768 [Talaromyces pinophilus]|nr:hypothetical protein DPV78_005768 [Talaromyces pinophilus]